MVQTELHRHLDVSIRTATFYELAQKLNLIAKSDSLESFKKRALITEPLTGLNEVLEKFTLSQKVLDRIETLERVAYECVEDCYRDGTRKVELRFSPSFVTQLNSMSWDDALLGFERGVQKALKKYPDIKAGLICIATREFGTDSVSKTVEFFLKNRSRFIGFDLAGSESQFPCRMFGECFKPLRKAGAKITVHAGEDSGPENIWQALDDLGAQRIGHGIRCVDDPDLMKHLAEKKICLEVCPTSNRLTKITPDLRKHPLALIVRAGIRASINTDDPGMFDVTLSHELRLATDIIGLSKKELEWCVDSADQASFL